MLVTFYCKNKMSDIHKLRKETFILAWVFSGFTPWWAGFEITFMVEGYDGAKLLISGRERQRQRQRMREIGARLGMGAYLPGYISVI